MEDLRTRELLQTIYTVLSTNYLNMVRGFAQHDSTDHNCITGLCVAYMSTGQATMAEMMYKFKQTVINYNVTDEDFITRSMINEAKNQIAYLSNKYTPLFEKAVYRGALGNVKTNFSGQHDIIDILYHSMTGLVDENSSKGGLCVIAERPFITLGYTEFKIVSEDDKAIFYAVVNDDTRENRYFVYAKQGAHKENRAITGLGLSDLAAFANYFIFE